MTTMLETAAPEEAGFDPDRIALIRERAGEWVDHGRMPALSLLVARHGRVVLNEAWGKQTYLPDSPDLTTDHLFFLTSLSKMFTATAAMILVDDGILSLTRPVNEYIPELRAEGAERILVHHLLTHTSGYYDQDILPEFFAGSAWDSPMARMLDIIYRTSPRRKPMERNVYCTPNIVLVAEIVRRLTNTDFAAFVSERVFDPLGMTSTFLELPESMDHRVALRNPDEEMPGADRESWRRAMGGGGGFSNARDLAVFCQAFLNGGRYGDARLLSRAAVHEMTRNQIPGTGVVTWDKVWIPEASWGIGWMVQATNRWKYDHGALQPVGSFYHQGAVSGGAWADHASGVTGVYLSLARFRSRETLNTDWEFPVFQNMVSAAVAD